MWISSIDVGCGAEASVKSIVVIVVVDSIIVIILSESVNTIRVRFEIQNFHSLL